MEYRLGNSRKIKSRGNTPEIICPSCNKKGQFGVFSNFERHLAVKPTLFDLNTVYFLICPNCAAAYTVDEQIGEAFKNGDIDISTLDLSKLKEFKPQI